ncbi:hypothetical protein BCR35DRAFT_313096 [Leucosporidium creatinivorum]|uniref:DASH complex subunit SPC34 n=1 Tax=Leucosporidium creatinivorum TaxID=106004 RepID=A0A1Y2FVS5_9BASI|nr:hypothetical protein BCR35DRAFT_313096 [Leucosporidium creatinivorum]
MSYIPAALSSLQSSTALLNSLHFTHSPSLSLALLSPESTFETHLIRDAAPHELALFQPSSTRYDAPILLDSADLSLGHHEERWTAAKRAPPQRVGGWEKASPLKERRVQGQEDPNRCLKAAERLLDIYPMPRAQEHVQALQDQYEGLMNTLHELEGQLKRPIPRSALNPHAEEHARAAELEELIKREQMEIFALEQLKVEKEAEIQASANTRPAPRKPPAATLKPSRSRASLGREAADPSASANPFAKSSLLEAKRAAASTSTAKASPPRAARPARSTPTASPGSTPQTTPRATRTRTSLGSASASGSPVKSPARTTSSSTATPKSPARATASSARRSIGGASATGETTPKRRSLGGAGGRKSVGGAGGKKGAEGVSQDDLEAIATKIWSVPVLGDALRPWGRKTLQAQDEEVPDSLDKLSCEQTMCADSPLRLFVRARR